MLRLILLADLGNQGFARRYLQIDYRIWNVPQDEQSNNLRQLREAIVTKCRNIVIDQQTIQRSFDCMVTRVTHCINARGHAFEDE